MGYPASLPPFSHNITRNDYASVRYNGGKGFTLSQNATSLPCAILYPSGKRLVDEFDLFAGSIPQYDTAYPMTFLNKSEPLSSLSHIVEAAAVHPSQIHLADATCPVTRAVIGSGIVVTDFKTRQVFFYQISFSILPG